MASCWTVCETMIHLEKFFLEAVQLLTSQLLSTLENVIIDNFKDNLCSLLSFLLSQGHWDDISRMYRLLCKVRNYLIKYKNLCFFLNIFLL